MPNFKTPAKAVILVGGAGTRLQPLTDNIPKPMVPVLNKPFLEHTLAYLRYFGIEDIILASSYLPEVIRDYFGDGQKFGLRLSYCLEIEPRGTAGAVKNAAPYLDGTFFVLNGDIFTDLDLAELMNSHYKNRATATLALKWVNDPGPFGAVATHENGKILSFIEKPSPQQKTTNWINAGIYILEPEVLDLIPSDCHFMFENGLFPRLLELGRPVYGYPFNGYWLDMGNPAKYFVINNDILTSKTSSRLLSIQDTAIGLDAVIHPSADIMPPVVIGRGSRIDAGVIIKGPAVIGNSCHLEPEARVEKAIFWDNVRIGPSADICHCIITGQTNIEAGKRVSDRVITPSAQIILP